MCLFQIRLNGLSSDYANPLNAVALSLSLVQLSLGDGEGADPFSVKTLQHSIEEMPTYTDFVINTLLPRAAASANESVRNLTRHDFVEANPEAVRRLDELADLMRSAVRRLEGRILVHPSTVAEIGSQMSLILLGKHTSGFVRSDLVKLTKALLGDGGVRVDDAHETGPDFSPL